MSTPARLNQLAELRRLAVKVHEAREHQRKAIGTLPTEARTAWQRELASRSGTPQQFAEACIDAIGGISIDECGAAIAEYLREWNSGT